MQITNSKIEFTQRELAQVVRFAKIKQTRQRQLGYHDQRKSPHHTSLEIETIGAIVEFGVAQIYDVDYSFDIDRKTDFGIDYIINGQKVDTKGVFSFDRGELKVSGGQHKIRADVYILGHWQGAQAPLTINLLGYATAQTFIKNGHENDYGQWALSRNYMQDLQKFSPFTPRTVDIYSKVKKNVDLVYKNIPDKDKYAYNDCK
jgi:hypothetical protein